MSESNYTSWVEVPRRLTKRVLQRMDRAAQKQGVRLDYFVSGWFRRRRITYYVRGEHGNVVKFWNWHRDMVQRHNQRYDKK